MKNKLWFRRKNYGWGWSPSTWEGCLVLLVWLVLFTFGLVKLDHEWLKNVVVMFVLTILLIWICYKKGEKPRWSWGRR